MKIETHHYTITEVPGVESIVIDRTENGPRIVIQDQDMTRPPRAYDREHLATLITALSTALDLANVLEREDQRHA